MEWRAHAPRTLLERFLIALAMSALTGALTSPARSGEVLEFGLIAEDQEQQPQREAPAPDGIEPRAADPETPSSDGTANDEDRDAPDSGGCMFENRPLELLV